MKPATWCFNSAWCSLQLLAGGILLHWGTGWLTSDRHSNNTIKPLIRHPIHHLTTHHIMSYANLPISQPVGPSVMSTSQQVMPSHCKVAQWLSMLCGQTSGGHLALPHGTMLAIHVGVALACHVLVSNWCSGMDHTLEGFHDCA